MRNFLAALLGVHGFIHVLGFLGAVTAAGGAVLQAPPSARVGVLWLAAAVLLVASAVLLLAGVRAWWIPALAGVVLSQALIVGAWSEAKWGTLANLVVLVPLLVVLLDFRAGSLHSTYARVARRALARAEPVSTVTEGDLASLPAPVRAWLRRAGVVGRPRVRNLHAVFEAEMRAGPDAKWMPARADQYEFFAPAERLFFMRAARAGVPFDVLHHYTGEHATMEARIAGLIPVLDVGGREMRQSETVTLLNDMCVLAPATLVDARIAWETIDDRTVRATFTNAGQRVSAVLTFDAAGDLAGFRSEDRWLIDARHRRPLPWSTPVSEYRDFGGVRLPAFGEARWTDSTGEWAYGRFRLRDIAYNVRSN